MPYCRVKGSERFGLLHGNRYLPRMRSPLENGDWLVLDEVVSTQTELAQRVAAGGNYPAAILALHQTGGRGRFDRKWLSAAGDSLTMSLAFPAYADHPKPWLVSMAAALAAASAIHAKVQWPNDLVLSGKKVGGILSEIVAEPSGRKIPVIGIGINLNQTEFPKEIADRAISLAQQRPGGNFEARRIADQILDRLASLPEPESWDALRPVWMLFDATPSKSYLTSTGEKGTALGIGPEGELILSVDGETQTVVAADALFGSGS